MKNFISRIDPVLLTCSIVSIVFITLSLTNILSFSWWVGLAPTVGCVIAMIPATSEGP